MGEYYSRLNSTGKIRTRLNIVGYSGEVNLADESIKSTHKSHLYFNHHLAKFMPIYGVLEITWDPRTLTKTANTNCFLSRTNLFWIWTFTRWRTIKCYNCFIVCIVIKTWSICNFINRQHHQVPFKLASYCKLFRRIFHTSVSTLNNIVHICMKSGAKVLMQTSLAVGTGISNNYRDRLNLWLIYEDSRLSDILLKAQV